MKKILSISLILFSFFQVHAQYAGDALRYGLENQTGTARFRAMSGAMGAVGGDLSSIMNNPAGSALFLNNQAGATLSSYNAKNQSNYFRSGLTNTDNTLDVNQIGALWVYDNTSDSPWKKISLAINYDNMGSFNDSRVMAGYNPTHSIDQYFLSYANGIPASDLNAFPNLNNEQFQAGLGVQSGIISPTGSNTYASNVTGNGNYYQENTIVSSGFNGKLAFNAGTSYKDRIYFGVNLNLLYNDYTRKTRFYEDYYDSPGHDATTGPQRVQFDNSLHTYGNGLSIQAGVIAKLYKGLRAGVAYQSPSWIWLKDEIAQGIHTESAANEYVYKDQFYVEFPTYRVRTPGSVTGSLAYIFGTRGSLSFDYILKDYTQTHLGPGEDFAAENAVINNTFDQTTEYRIGGEYNIQNWSLRGGYRFAQSPYKDNTQIGNLKSFSTGVGYSFGDTKIDVSYTHARQNSRQQFFDTGFTGFADVKGKYNNFSLTVLFEL